MQNKKRGGAREGAGRKAGSKTSNRTEIFTKRISKDEKAYLENCLQEYRKARGEL